LTDATRPRVSVAETSVYVVSDAGVPGRVTLAWPAPGWLKVVMAPSASVTEVTSALV
jgi:hypothetical protein